MRTHKQRCILEDLAVTKYTPVPNYLVLETEGQLGSLSLPFVLSTYTTFTVYLFIVKRLLGLVRWLSG